LPLRDQHRQRGGCPALRDYAKTLPYVEHVADNLYSCSQDTQDTIAQVIKANNLNRIVVAACTPKTHEPLFQETLVNAGLNKYLFEMTNIRNQDSWVHKDNPGEATEKAKDLVRMAVAKVALMESLPEAPLEINQRALVLGGGISGMVAAKSLSDQGYEVDLLEKASALGGQALNLYKTWLGEDIQENLKALVTSVQGDKNIRTHLGAELTQVEGFVGISSPPSRPAHEGDHRAWNRRACHRVLRTQARGVPPREGFPCPDSPGTGSQVH